MGGEWEDVEPGRCKHLRLPYLSVCVLDAPSHFEASSPFAAILVPRGQELDWVFCVPNGLWDLVFSASVSRLVVLHRLTHQREGEEHLCVHPRFQAGESVTGTSTTHVCVDVATHNSNEKDRVSGISQSYALSTDRVNVNEDGNDVSFKKSITPLLHSLFPWRICPHGPAPDPYVTYEDHVRTRVIVEIRNLEALGGGILVEDVELNCNLDDDTSIVGMESNKCRRILRRRMRFQQMPNLIQTEMPIAIYKNGQLTSMHGLEDVKAVQEKLASNHSLEKESVMERGKVGEVFEEELEIRLDHSKLVHKYLPPIVAGLVLASPCLEACIAANTRARFLAIGLGGGALPIFLHRQFGFSVLAVDTNEIVVDLARRHFGLVDNEHLQVQVKDGMDVVFRIAHQACNNNFGSIEVAKDWQAAFKHSAQELCQGKSLSGFDPNDARMHVIVVDVNVADAHLGLLSPPPCFLSTDFLLAVRMALHEGGMLVINVIPRAKQYLNVVVDSLRRVFSGIYQIKIEDNHVLFAFPSKIADINMSCVFALDVAHAIGEELFDKIEEFEESIDG